MTYISKKKIRGVSSSASAAFVNTFTRMSDAELKATLNRAHSLSITNCGWTEYTMKNAIIQICNMELEERAFEKKRLKKTRNKTKDNGK